MPNFKKRHGVESYHRLRRSTSSLAFWLSHVARYAPSPARPNLRYCDDPSVNISCGIRSKFVGNATLVNDVINIQVPTKGNDTFEWYYITLIFDPQNKVVNSLEYYGNNITAVKNNIIYTKGFEVIDEDIIDDTMITIMSNPDYPYKVIYANKPTVGEKLVFIRKNQVDSMLEYIKSMLKNK